MGVFKTRGYQRKLIFQKWTETPASFCLFWFLGQQFLHKNVKLQWDSKAGHQSRRQAHWLLYHHLDPAAQFFKVPSDLLLALNIAETLLIPHLSGCCGVVSAHEPSPQLTAFRSQSVWLHWTIYRILGNFLKPSATINLPKCPTFLDYDTFTKMSIIFLVV